MSAFGVKRTSQRLSEMSAFDPKRTFHAAQRVSFELVPRLSKSDADAGLRYGVMTAFARSVHEEMIVRVISRFLPASCAAPAASIP